LLYKIPSMHEKIEHFIIQCEKEWIAKTNNPMLPSRQKQ